MNGIASIEPKEHPKILKNLEKEADSPISRVAQKAILQSNHPSDSLKLKLEIDPIEEAYQRLNHMGRTLKPESWQDKTKIEHYATELQKYYQILLDHDKSKQKSLLANLCLYNKPIQFPPLARIVMFCAFNQFLEKRDPSSELHYLFKQCLSIACLLRALEVRCPHRCFLEGINTLLQKVENMKDTLPKDFPFILIPGGWSLPNKLQGESHQMFILLFKEKEEGWRIFLINTNPTKEHNFRGTELCQQAAVISEDLLTWNQVTNYLMRMFQLQIDRFYSGVFSSKSFNDFSYSEIYSHFNMRPLPDSSVTIPIFLTPTCISQSIFALFKMWHFLTKTENSATEDFLQFQQEIFNRYKNSLPIQLKEQIESELFT